ncbi:hypothetical protein [Streptomyces sp. NPDC049944]
MATIGEGRAAETAATVSGVDYVAGGEARWTPASCSAYGTFPEP